MKSIKKPLFVVAAFGLVLTLIAATPLVKAGFSRTIAASLAGLAGSTVGPLYVIGENPSDSGVLFDGSSITILNVQNTGDTSVRFKLNGSFLATVESGKSRAILVGEDGSLIFDFLGDGFEPSFTWAINP